MGPLLALFAVGALLGTLLDALHTHFAITAYTHEVVFKMAWWTPLVFGAAGLLPGATYRLLYLRGRSASTPFRRCYRPSLVVQSAARSRSSGA